MSDKHDDHAKDGFCPLDPLRFVAEVDRSCSERGLKLTPLRREVLELVAHSAHPVKAYELLEQLRARRAGAAPPTVYRALEFLVAHGFVHRIESMNAFIGCHHPSARHDGPFLICDVCQRAYEIEDLAIARAIEDQARRLGFRPRSQTVEIHGVCAACTDAR